LHGGSSASKAGNLPFWGTLPNWVVSAINANAFKQRLDQHWQLQDIIYDFLSPQ